MENASNLREKLKNGQIPLGCGVSFTDPTVSELFSYVLDFVSSLTQLIENMLKKECEMSLSLKLRKLKVLQRLILYFHQMMNGLTLK